MYSWVRGSWWCYLTVISSGPQSSPAGSPAAWLGAVQLLCLPVVSAGKDALVIPLVAKWTQTSDIMTLFCPTHSACLTLSAAIVWAHSTPASKLKCPFALGDEACVWVGRAVEQSFMEMLWKRSFGVCVSGRVNYWHIQWVLSSFNFLLFPKLARNVCCFAKQNGSLGYLKTTPFPCVGFCSDELIEETPGGRERGVCLLEKIVRSTEESEAWFLALELPGWEGLLCLSYNQLPSRDRAALASVVTSLDGRIEGHPWTFALSKLLGSFHHPGHGETFLMMTEGVRMTLNLTWRK